MSKSRLDAHIKATHMARSEQRKFVCSTCGAGFAVKGRLVEHMRIHNNVKQFVCNVGTCDK